MAMPTVTVPVGSDAFLLVLSDQASTSFLLVCLSSIRSLVASADLLEEQPPALATLAKAAITMIAMITVPPKKAIFG